MEVDYITNSVFNSRTYILSQNCSEEVWLVDCGDFDRVMERIGDKRIVGLLLTHAHFDHIYGIPLLLEKFPDCLICANEYALKALSDIKLNMSKYHGQPICVMPDNFYSCHDGSHFGIFEDCEVLVYETPGHNPGCSTFEIDKHVFTGDAYIPGKDVVTVLPGSDKEKANESLRRIRKIADGKVICAGHEV